MRSPSKNDLVVDVDGIGRFVFARRKMQDTYRIRGEYNALTSGNVSEDGTVGDLEAFAFVTLQVLMVAAPSSFDLDSMDPLVDDCSEKVMNAFMALRKKESSFRPGPAPELQTGSAPGGELVRDGVSEEIQLTTN